MAEAKWSGVLSTTDPRNDVGIIKVRQGNVNSEIVEFQIVQNNKPYDLTGLTVYFCASFGLNLVEKPAVVVNTTGGKIQYTFDDDSMQAVGRQKGYFSIKKEESKIDSTQDFEFQVDSSLMTRSIDGKSYIYKLSTLIKVLDDFIKNGQNNFNNWFDSVKELLYGIDPGGNILRELIEARTTISGKVFSSLKERLNETDFNMNENNFELAPMAAYKIFEPEKASDQYAEDIRGSLSMSSDEFLNLFYDRYINNNKYFDIIKTNLGLDESGLYSIYEYELTPKLGYTEQAGFTSGMHPYELSAHFGLAYFIEQLMNPEIDHEFVTHIRQKTSLKIIPIINPWAWNQAPKKYGNINGVNINRNFDYNGSWAAYPTILPTENEWNYKGTAPYSEAETRILRDWMIANKNFMIWIDMHTSSDDATFDNYIYYQSNDPLKDKYQETISLLSNRIKNKYRATAKNNVIVDSKDVPRIDLALSLGLSTFTLEQSPRRTLWGSSKNNDGSDITEYATYIAAYLTSILDVKVSGTMQLFKSTTDLLFNENEKNLIEKYKKAPVIIMDNFADTVKTGRRTNVGNRAFSNLDFNFSNGKAKGANASGSSFMIIPARTSDFLLSTEVEFGSYASLIFKYIDVSNYSAVRMNNTGINIHTQTPSGATIYADYPFVPVIGRKYTLSVVVERNHAIVFLDGKAILKTNFLPDDKNENAGLRTFSDNLSAFDNLTIRGYVDTRIAYPTLKNGWSGTLQIINTGDGYIAISGDLIAGTTAYDTIIAETDAKDLPKFGVPISVQKIATTSENIEGLYLSTSNLVIRVPASNTITTEDRIIFNTIYYV